MKLDDTATAMTFAEIGDELGVSWQAARIAVGKAQRKVAAALLERLGHAVVDVVRDEPLRHDDPRRLR